MTAPHVSPPPAGLPPELASHPRYRVLRELGRGGMGVVYHAEQTMMDRQVAIKVISKAVLDHPDTLERFGREVRAAARLSHPNIVIAYDAEQAGDLHMLVMEFVEGHSLSDVLQRKGPLPVAHACSYVRQAALGLQHAFEKGMVHRDIKPANLMLTKEGQVKVLDFGLAKLVRETGRQGGMTTTGSYMGTPDYSAPEQATDARTADIRADIYSLGCTLYCLLAGRPPFQEDTAVKTILAHLDRAPQPLPELRPDVPAGLWAVVARMLAKDPAQRYQKPAEAAQALAPFCKPKTRATPPVVVPTARLAPAPDTTLPAGASGHAAETSPGTGPLTGRAAPAEPAAAPAGRRWWLVAAAVAAAGAAAVILVVVGVAVVAGALLLARGESQDTAPRATVAPPAPPGLVLLDVNPPDARVLVDGQPVPDAAPGDEGPRRLELPPGEHALDVTREGFLPHSRQVTLTAGQAEHVTVGLTREPPVVKKSPERRPRAGALVSPAAERPPAAPVGGPASATAGKPPAPAVSPGPGPRPDPRAAAEAKAEAERRLAESLRQEEARRQALKEQEEEQRRRDEAKEEAKRKAEEEVQRKAEAESRQQDAARLLKPAKDLIDRIKLARLEQDDRQADKLRERAGERLQEIVKKYPETQAAAEARELLDKLGR